MPSAQRHAFYRSVQSTRGGAQIAPSSSMKSWACWRSPAVRDSNSRSSTSSYTSASSWTCAARAGSQRSAERLERRSDAGIQQRPMAVQGRASCCSVRSPPPSRSARSSAAAASCCSVRRPRRREGRLAIAATASATRHQKLKKKSLSNFKSIQSGRSRGRRHFLDLRPLRQRRAVAPPRSAPSVRARETFRPRPGWPSGVNHDWASAAPCTNQRYC